MPEGKQKLILAALRLAAREGVPLQKLGLRELAREADLNHNTFYRHFSSLGELAEATIQVIASQMVVGMKNIRIQAKSHIDATEGVAAYFLDLVQSHPEAFMVGVRELHNASSVIRPMLLKVLEGIAQESVTQIQHYKLVPLHDPQLLLAVTRDITSYMFSKSIDFIRQPGSRERIHTELVQFIRRQFIGAVALAAMQQP